MVQERLEGSRRVLGGSGRVGTVRENPRASGMVR